MKIAILGAYQTRFGELWDKSLEDLTAEAVLGTIKNAGIKKEKIQIGFFGNKIGSQTSDQNHFGSLIAEILGVSTPFIRVEAACASGGLAIAQACMAIESGQYEVALVIGAEKMTDLPTEKISQALMNAASAEERTAGLSFVGLYALMARRYLEDFGVKEEDLAAVPVKNHSHASFNPKAQYPFPITVRQVIESAPVASPLKLLDCSPISDGAAGLVLTSFKFAKKLSRETVSIVASSQATESLSLDKREKLTEIASSKKAGLKAFAQAGVGPKDIDLAEVHDCFSIAEIFALEDIGFYKKGQAWQAAVNGETKLGGKRPINLSGGLKACGHPVGATGVKQIVELYNQLLGRAGRRQTKKARVGLAHNVGGSGGTAAVHIVQI